MTITVTAVHPNVAIVTTESGQYELPVDWFPQPPKIGQVWSIKFDHEPTESEKLDQLNAYLAKD